MNATKFANVNKILSISTGVLTLLLAMSAFALSYSVLYELATTYGFKPWLAWLWPLSLDAFVVIATIAIVRNSLCGESTKYPIFLVGIFSLLSIILNIIDTSDPVWLTQFNPRLASIIDGVIYVLIHGLPPTVVFLSIELAGSIGKSEVKRYAEIKTQEQLQMETEEIRQRMKADLDRIVLQREQLEATIVTLQSKQSELKNEVDNLKRQQRQAKRQQPAGVSDSVVDQARTILAEWYATGVKPNGSELGRRLGKSPSLGRQLKRDLWHEIVANGS